jgi:hypothetical protein
VGIAAWRYDWLRQLSWDHARPWIWALVIAWPCMPVVTAVARALNGPDKSNFSGGLSWPAILYALWEPFVAWGLIAAWLLVFRQRMNKPSDLWAWLSRRSYAVYIIHSPVLVAIALLFHGWTAPALVKFGVRSRGLHRQLAGSRSAGQAPRGAARCVRPGCREVLQDHVECFSSNRRTIGAGLRPRES